MIAARRVRAVLGCFVGVSGLVLWFGVTALAQSATPAARTSVRDGLFSAAQARRGQAAYETACAECHMPDLSGREYAGTLAGFGFQLKWQDGSVAELYGRVRSMPLGRPGSLTQQQYVDIVAYILEKNAYPSGDHELTAAVAGQRWPRIPIERTTP